MKRVPIFLALFMLAQPALGQTIPLRYQGLNATPRFRLADVLGSPEMQPAGGHTSFLTPDGKFALFCTGGFSPLQEQTADSVLSLWDVRKGIAIKEILIARAEVLAASLSADAAFAVTILVTVDPKGLETNRLVLWDMQTGKELRTIARPKALLSAVALAPDDTRVLVGSREGKIQLLDVVTGKEAVQFKEQLNQVIFHALFSSDGKQAFTTWGQKIRLWDPGTGKILKTFGDHPGEVVTLALSADGKRLASAANDQSVRVWDVETGKSLYETKRDPAGGALISLGLSPDGSKLVVVNNGFDAMTGTREESSVNLIDVAAKKEIWTQDANFKGFVPVLVPAKGEILIGGGANAWTSWNMDKGLLQSTWGGHKAPLLAVAHDAGNLYSVGQDGQSKIWVRDGAPKSFLGPRESATALVARDALVLAAGADKALVAWNDRLGKALRIPTTHTAAITCVALASNGKRAASGSADRTVKIWDLENSRELRSFMGHAEIINSVAFSPDGQWAASASDDNNVRLWPLEKKTDDDPIIFEEHKRQVTCVAFSPDGKYLVSGSQDQTLKMWDVDKGKVIRTFTGHKNWIGAILFRGADQLLSASDDLTVRVWDVKTGKELDKIDLGPVSDCPKCLALHGGNLYVGTAGWVILKLQMTDGKK